MTGRAELQFPGISVELSRIEQEFREIWKQTTDSSNPDAVLKASTLNLVITCNTPDRLPVIFQHVPELTLHHPGRIIIVYIDRNNPSAQITATITAFCQPPRYDGKQICCELVSLETGPAGKRYLPGALLPLLLPDLPVFLWTPNNLVLHSPAFSNFHKNIERVILHSPASLPTVKALYEMAGAILKTAEMSKVSDMTWAALTGWREAIAGFFDGQNGPELLRNTSSIDIRYSGAGVSLPAHLLTGWLAFLLKWRHLSGREGEYTFITPQGRPVVVCCKPDGKAIHGKELVAVTINLEPVNGDSLVFTAEQGAENEITTIAKKDDQLIFVNKIRNPAPDEAHLLCAELDNLYEDKVYLGAVQQVYKLLTAGTDGKAEIY
ncbi:MAG TPA: glucose-6-phosphate dehydrogenase assembly protein OpcA [bacterium]|nr:glucose-6-phosphate dehydrogenase assembly protein OpcA [bacterium]HPN44340.1 glucose-6-phosphate dehydrogenase assembly protein OpcA [bacterium]